MLKAVLVLVLFVFFLIGVAIGFGQNSEYTSVKRILGILYVLFFMGFVWSLMYDQFYVFLGAGSGSLFVLLFLIILAAAGDASREQKTPFRTLANGDVDGLDVTLLPEEITSEEKRLFGTLNGTEIYYREKYHRRGGFGFFKIPGKYSGSFELTGITVGEYLAGSVVNTNQRTPSGEFFEIFSPEAVESRDSSVEVLRNENVQGAIYRVFGLTDPGARTRATSRGLLFYMHGTKHVLTPFQQLRVQEDTIELKGSLQEIKNETSGKDLASRLKGLVNLKNHLETEDGQLRR
ncbi:MAG: hypothetical protein ABEJ65_00305 [bacterium]